MTTEKPILASLPDDENLTPPMWSGDRCGCTVWDAEGEAQPCDRPATGWRWYQGHDHEDTLDVACALHENEGGRRLHAAEAALAEERAKRESYWVELQHHQAKLARVEALREEVRAEQNRCCIYGTTHGDGRRCDCKFPFPGRMNSEASGCPERRRFIDQIDAALTGPTET